MVKLRSKFKWKMKGNEKEILRQTERCNYLQQAFYKHLKIFTPSTMRPTKATFMQDLTGNFSSFSYLEVLTEVVLLYMMK